MGDRGGRAMACFTLGWIEQILIWLIVLGAVVALIKLVLPLVLSNLGVVGSTIVAALNIVLWAIVAIALVIFIFDLIGCLVATARPPSPPPPPPPPSPPPKFYPPTPHPSPPPPS